MRRARLCVLIALTLAGCGGGEPTGPAADNDLGYVASDLAGGGGGDLSQCLDCCHCAGAPGTCSNGVCLVKEETATTPVPPADSCGNVCLTFGYGCSTECSWQRVNPSTGTVETIIEAGVAAYANPQGLNTKTQYLDTCDQIPPARSTFGDPYNGSTCCCTPR